jgi:hypothetical protein
LKRTPECNLASSGGPVKKIRSQSWKWDGECAECLEIATGVSTGADRACRWQNVAVDSETRQMPAQMLEIMMGILGLQFMKMEANDTDEFSSGCHQACSG